MPGPAALRSGSCPPGTTVLGTWPPARPSPGYESRLLSLNTPRRPPRDTPTAAPVLCGCPCPCSPKASRACTAGHGRIPPPRPGTSLCQPGDLCANLETSVPALRTPLCQPCLRLRFRGNLVVNHPKVINEAVEHDPSQEVPGCPAAATPLWCGLLSGHPPPTGPTAVTLLICSGQAAPGHSGEGWHNDGTTQGTATVTVQPSQGCLLGRG